MSVYVGNELAFNIACIQMVGDKIEESWAEVMALGTIPEPFRLAPKLPLLSKMGFLNI